MTRAMRIGLFGCPPDTGNRGVDALRIATIEGLRKTGVDVDVTVFDYRSGIREAELETGTPIHRAGLYFSRRFHSPGNLQQLYVAARMGLGRVHPMTSYLRGLDAVFDISGGDSFSDIYGARRFRGNTLFKEVALALGSKLVLLPQTYGPFEHEKNRVTARRLINRASQVWARDEHSLSVVRDLLGAEFDSERQRQTIDVAFGLPVIEPRDPKLTEIFQAFRARAGEVAGLNVSGLLYNRPGYDREIFGFKTNYRELIDALIARLLSDPDQFLVLVPHVASQYKHDCDETACRNIFEALDPKLRSRVFCLPAGLNAMEVKWAVGQCNWMCATRMHAAIAGISQSVPTAAIAYSDKTLGVFETAGAGECVVDPRTDSGEGLLAAIADHFEHRVEWRTQLEAGRRERTVRLDQFFSELTASCR